VGVQKPDARVFLHALKETGAKRKESLMIGDSLEADVLGARRVGMEAVYFNPESKPHGASLKFEIRDLRDLLQWL
jgi:putative hydrolase of the HAD superfamily